MSDESKVKIDDLFAAESKTIRRIFGVDSTGFYVPAYQRDYSWDSEKVERLLDDVLFGTYNTLDNHKSITFLGTIIVVETSNDNDQKITRGTSPEAILGIVDGQQRLTTLLMLIVALHSELRTYNVDDLPESMKKNVNRFLGALEKLYLMDISNEYDESDNNIHVLYPKIIRSCDVWSDSDKTHLKAFYGSPISQFIWQYIQFSKDSTTSRQIFDYDPKSDPDSVAHTNFRSTFEKIKKYIRDRIKKEHDEIDSPPVTLIVSEIAKVFKSFSSFNALGESDVRKYEDLIRLMFFTQFFLERVAITQIRADSEDFAFDMFESLNSTGEPLTAFETFRPKIIIQDQEGSETDNHAIADDIASILDSKTIDEKKRRTDNFIIAFAVAEIGHKLPKKLYMQRSFLRESFNNTPNEDRQGFINHMHHVAKFMRHFWFTEDITKENSRSFGLKCELSLGKDALMCLQYLRDVNHTVTIPILSRYYTKIIMTSEEDQMETLFHEFELAIKSVTAFSILWRAFVGGTSGIDTVYRDLVAGKLKIVGDLVFSRRIKKDRTEINTKVPSISELKKAFRDILREHKQMRISSRETWIKRASDELKYIKQKEVNKFIILAAFHFSQTNKNESGMLKRASNNRGGQETLLIDMWNDVDFSLEHIAPQSDQHWHGSDIYNSAVTVHKLGNLVFLNQSINNTLTNRSWKEKKQIFDLLSTQDDEDFRKKSEDLNITVNIEKLARYGFLPHLSSLTLVESWNKIMIESRTENLLSLAWDTIYPWLEDN